MKNAISIAGLSEFSEEVKKMPVEAEMKFGVEVEWETGTRAKASTKTLDMGAHKVARNFSWTVDEPRQLLGTNHAPNPQEYLLSGLGACLMVSFMMGATAKGIQVEALKIDVEGDLDLRGFMGQKTNKPIGFPELRYKISVSGEATEEEFESLRKEAEKHSPTCQTLAAGLPVIGELKIA